MEDILSSIKRIIADGSDRTAPARPLRRKVVDRYDGELTTGEDGTSDRADDQGASAVPVSVAPAVESEPAILELTDMVEESPAMNDVTATTRKATPATAAPQMQADDRTDTVQDDGILSDISAQAARESLSQLSSMLVRPAEGEANTLDGLVREMLRPMMKEWLEARLPDLVQSMVKKEIDRIVGRLG